MTTWATPEQASSITGKTVTLEMLEPAQEILDVVTGVTTEATANLSSRDLKQLRKALAYQAYWMSKQVDYFSRVDVDEVSQDGVIYSKGNPDAFQVAPLAMLCIKRLSWFKQRSLRPRPPGSKPNPRWDPRVIDRDGDVWTPL